MVRRPLIRRRDRRKTSAASPAVAGNANVTRVEITDAGYNIWFDSPVILQPGQLPLTWYQGSPANRITVLNFSTPQVWSVQWAGFGNDGDPYTIVAGDPAVRTPQGGFVNGHNGLIA